MNAHLLSTNDDTPRWRPASPEYALLGFLAQREARGGCKGGASGPVCIGPTHQGLEGYKLGPGYPDAVLKNVVSYADNVRSVLSKVTLGEADAGIVYTIDVSRDASSKVTRIDIPDAKQSGPANEK